jgi:hypothetical protein
MEWKIIDHHILINLSYSIILFFSPPILNSILLKLELSNYYFYNLKNT